MSPDHVWTLAERLTFNVWFKQWLKNYRRDRRVNVEPIEKREIDLNKPLSSSEWDMYAGLSHDEGRGRILGDQNNKLLEEFKERIKRNGKRS
jgi:hypothetical protein